MTHKYMCYAYTFLSCSFVFLPLFWTSRLTLFNPHSCETTDDSPDCIVDPSSYLIMLEVHKNVHLPSNYTLQGQG